MNLDLLQGVLVVYSETGVNATQVGKSGMKTGSANAVIFHLLENGLYL